MKVLGDDGPLPSDVCQGPNAERTAGFVLQVIHDNLNADT